MWDWSVPRHIHRRNESLAIEEKRHVVCASERVCAHYSIVVSTFLNTAYECVSVCVLSLFRCVQIVFFISFHHRVPFLVMCLCRRDGFKCVYSIYFLPKNSLIFFGIGSFIFSFSRLLCRSGVCVYVWKKRARARHTIQLSPRKH